MNIYLICLLILITLGNYEQNCQNTISLVAESEDKLIIVEGEENIYSDRINYYKTLVNIEYKRSSHFEKVFNSFEQARVFYALEDIDKNGVSELLIGIGNTENIICYDIYAVENPTWLKDLFFEWGYGEFGEEKTLLYIYSNGIMEIRWHVSPYVGGSDFFKISSDGYHSTLIERMSYDYYNYGTPKFYHYKRKFVELSEDEYNQITQELRSEGEAKLSWIEIIP